ncbi:hypothetical protein [Clostridium botulinum]|uniref:hypothetical protein n=1 Tax=Clostridium botulinum TaxID=1491 RepID=UPI000A177242|nr:hypothetical protein [Clostridium botulinum]OSA79381.1 hypothetical protein B2H89_13020 [Clostridium botulinum]
MLRNLLEDYISSLKERDFDIPFLCILLKEGYFDIHFLHGTVEFGKDFIAKTKKDDKVIQCAFQSKAGDIKTSDFREIRLQCDEMRDTVLSHPNYDVTLERECFLVLTGRLKGNAPLLAQEYDRKCKEKNEIGLTIWDSDILIEKMLNKQLGYIGITGDKGNDILISYISKIKRNEIDHNSICKLIKYWCDVCSSLESKSCFGIILESAILTQELRKNSNLYLACSMCLMPLIPIMYNVRKQNIVHMEDYKNKYFVKIKGNYKRIITDFVNEIDNYDEITEGIYKNFQYGSSSIVTHSINCSKIIENVGLLGLMLLKEEDYDEANEVGKIIINLFNNNIATTHPVSDKYAYSLIPPMLFLHKLGYQNECEQIIKKTALWVLDRYEISKLGLAEVNASNYEEIERLLGYAFEFTEVNNRRESYLLTVLLDLSYAFGFYGIYKDILNDSLVLDMKPWIISTEDDEFQYIMSDNQLIYDNLMYRKEIDETKEKERLSVHYDTDKCFASLNNLAWENLAVLSNLRDRHRMDLIYSILED